MVSNELQLNCRRHHLTYPIASLFPAQQTSINVCMTRFRFAFLLFQMAHVKVMFANYVDKLLY